MNEEFSRLYHLAWNYAESDPEYQENATYERRCVVQSRIFAELIVAECAGVSLESSHRNDDMGAIISREIKKHFGVEE